MLVSLGFGMEYEVMITGIEPKIIKFEFHDGGLEGRCDYELETYKSDRKVFQMFSLACVSVKL
jgi:hypothetical protein